MATLGWFERITASFSALVRRRGWFFGNRSVRGAESSPLAERADALLPIISSSFGEAEGIDLEPLKPLLRDERSYGSVVEIVSLLGTLGLPYDADRVVAWHKLGIPPATLYAVFDLTKPATVPELDELLGVLKGHVAKIQVEPLTLVATAYQALGRPIAIGNLILAFDTLTSQVDRFSANSFTTCAQAFAALGLSDPQLDRALLERVKDEEALAASAALADVLAGRVGQVQSFNDIKGLFLGISDRITVRRLSRVLTLFDEYGVKAGDLDTFQLAFASQGAMDWLERALKGMKELGRTVDRLALMQLQEWAPDVVALSRYLTAARGFQGMGLTDDEVDRLVLKRVDSEDRSQVLGLIGELWFRLGFGEPTFDKAEHLADILTDRVRLKRYETAVNLLKETKMSIGDIQALAEQFIDYTDDINWLEAVLASAGEFGDRLGRLQILHLRERCPEPPHLYRYFRLRRAFAWFPGDFSSLDAWLVDLAPNQEKTNHVLALAEVLSQCDSFPATFAEIQDMVATYPTLELVEAYGVCLRTFNGDRRKFALILRQIIDSSDVEASLALISNALGDGRLSNSTFERALESLIISMKHPPTVSVPPGNRERGR